MLTKAKPSTTARATQSAGKPVNAARTTRTPISSGAASGGSAYVHTGHASYRAVTCAQLVRSRLNVRRKAGNGVAELAALIRSQGLLQNLIGYEQVVDGEPTGVIEVVAGARRLEALGMLIAAGDFPADFEVTCLIVPMNEAIAISLAENSGREPMHPADTFEAMRELAARGASIEDIALSFGVSALTVRRRLKLANVAPSFLTMYRDDAITFEQMAALAICDDHATQQQAWDSLGKWSRQPHQLRRLLTAQHIDIQTDRVVQFVGVKAFEAAGGFVLRDLFSESAGFIEDAALLERLGAAKLAVAAKELGGEGWAWVDVRCRVERAELAQHVPVRTTRRAMTDVECAEHTRIDAGLAAVREALDDAEHDADTSALEAEEAELEAQLDALEHSLVVPHAGDSALAGALVTISECGKLVVHRGLIRPADKAKMEKAVPVSESGMAGGEGQPAGRPVHSERLTHLLTAHRSVALHAELMARPQVALAVLAHGLIGQVFYPAMPQRRLAQIRLTLPEFPEEAQVGPAPDAVRARFETLKAMLPSDDAADDLLTWLLAQPESVLLELLAFCTGAAINTLQGKETRCSTFNALGRAVSLDMRKWWKPTVSTYFDHVTKARVLDVVKEAVSVEATTPLLHLRTIPLGAAAERLASESGWLPDAMRIESAPRPSVS